MLTTTGKNLLLKAIAKRDDNVGRVDDSLPNAVFEKEGKLQWFKDIQKHGMPSKELFQYEDFFYGFGNNGEKGFIFVVNKDMQLIDQPIFKVEKEGKLIELGEIIEFMIHDISLIFTVHDKTKNKDIVYITNMPYADNKTKQDFFIKNTMELNLSKREFYKLDKIEGDADEYFVCFLRSYQYGEQLTFYEFHAARCNIKKGQVDETLIVRPNHVKHPALTLEFYRNVRWNITKENGNVRITLIHAVNDVPAKIERFTYENARLVYPIVNLNKDPEGSWGAILKMYWMHKELPTRLKQMSDLFFWNPDELFVNSNNITLKTKAFQSGNTDYLSTDGSEYANYIYNYIRKNMKDSSQRLTLPKDVLKEYYIKRFVTQEQPGGGYRFAKIVKTGSQNCELKTWDEQWLVDRPAGKVYYQFKNFPNYLNINPIDTDLRRNFGVQATNDGMLLGFQSITLKGTEFYFDIDVNIQMKPYGIAIIEQTFGENANQNIETFNDKFTAEPLEILLKNNYVAIRYINEFVIINKQSGRWKLKKANYPADSLWKMRNVGNILTYIQVNKLNEGQAGVFQNYKNAPNVEKTFQNSELIHFNKAVSVGMLSYIEQNKVFNYIIDYTNAIYKQFYSLYDNSSPNSKPYFFRGYEDTYWKNLFPIRIKGQNDNKVVADTNISNMAISNNNVVLISQLDINTMNDEKNNKWVVTSTTNNDILEAHDSISKTDKEKKTIQYNINVRWKDINSNHVIADQSNKVTKLFNENITKEEADSLTAAQWCLTFENGNTFYKDITWDINYNKSVLKAMLVVKFQFPNNKLKKIQVLAQNKSVINEYVLENDINMKKAFKIYTEIFYEKGETNDRRKKIKVI